MGSYSWGRDIIIGLQGNIGVGDHDQSQLRLNVGYALAFWHMPMQLIFHKIY